jgi:hypothetical protein
MVEDAHAIQLLPICNNCKKNPTSSLIAIRKEEEVSKGHLHHQFQHSHTHSDSTLLDYMRKFSGKKRNCRISAANKFDIPRSMIVQPH